MAILYEVNIVVLNERAEEYKHFLGGHIPNILKCDGFLEAKTFQLTGDAPLSSTIVVHYYVDNNDSLQAYLSGVAQEMRKEATERFGASISINRRIMNNIIT